MGREFAHSGRWGARSCFKDRSSGNSGNSHFALVVGAARTLTVETSGVVAGIVVTGISEDGTGVGLDGPMRGRFTSRRHGVGPNCTGLPTRVRRGPRIRFSVHIFGGIPYSKLDGMGWDHWMGPLHLQHCARVPVCQVQPQCTHHWELVTEQ